MRRRITQQKLAKYSSILLDIIQPRHIAVTPVPPVSYAMYTGTPPPNPRYVYKIIPSAPPDPVPSEYPLSELDQKDGFVHLSNSTQVR